MVFKLLCLEPPKAPELLAPISLNDLKEVSRVKDIKSEGLSENIKPEQSISFKEQNEERGR